MFVNKEKNFN